MAVSNKEPQGKKVEAGCEAGRPLSVDNVTRVIDKLEQPKTSPHCLNIGPRRHEPLYEFHFEHKYCRTGQWFSICEQIDIPGQVPTHSQCGTTNAEVLKR